MKRFKLLTRTILATVLLMHSTPYAATAQAMKGSRQGDRKFVGLLLLVREAEQTAINPEVRSELKQARAAIERASENISGPGRGDELAIKDFSLSRDLLRHIVDEPRGESSDFQEKVAEALKSLEESAAGMWGDGTSRATTETAFGLHTATFDTLQGTVTAKLPDDLSAGDTISGTVVAEAKGKTPQEKAQNLDQLNGYVVELANQPVPVDNKVAKWAIPTTAAASIPLILKNLDGKEVAR